MQRLLLCVDADAYVQMRSKSSVIQFFLLVVEMWQDADRAADLLCMNATGAVLFDMHAHIMHDGIRQPSSALVRRTDYAAGGCMRCVVTDLAMAHILVA